MKILVIGIDGAPAEMLLGDEQLTNLRSLMAWGCFGLLKGVAPGGSIPVWMCLTTSRDPGSFAMVAPQDGSDQASPSRAAGSDEHAERIAIRDVLARAGKRTVTIDVPLTRPERQLSGTCAGSHITLATPDQIQNHTVTSGEEMASPPGSHAMSISAPGAESPELLGDRACNASREQFQVVRRVLQDAQWDYCQFIDTGLIRLRRGLARFSDRQHALNEAGRLYPSLIRDYCRHLDAQIGETLELLDDEAVVLIVSVDGEATHPRIDGCTGSPVGSFVLAASHSPLQGEIDGVHLLDLAPTLLDLGGCDVPPSMQGRSLVAGYVASTTAGSGRPLDEEELVRERLRGLGYIE